MPDTKHILCPVDFSATSEVALVYAVQLARQLSSRVTVLHVYQLMSLLYPDDVLVDPAGTDSQLREAMSKRLEETLDGVDTEGVQVDSVLREGIPYVQICQAATELNADMIVMGTHGRTGLRHALVGSVTERVLRTSPVPLLSVHKPGG